MSKEILNEKNCLITGATGTLGQCLAKRFAQDSCNLFLTSRSLDKLHNLKIELESINPTIKIFCEAYDLKNDNDINKLVKKAQQEFEAIDILINNAGIFEVKSILDTTVEDFNSMFNINIRAPFLLSKALCKDMIKKRWGRIINIGSTAAYNGFKHHSLYSASKHAILGFSRSLHEELKNDGVRVFCVSTGPLISKMGKIVAEKSNFNFNSFIEPEEVAEYISFAVSFNKEMISEEIRLHMLKEHVEQH